MLLILDETAACFGETELMTANLSTETNPLSRISIGVMADLGYTVDYNLAEDFDSSFLDPSCRCDQRSRNLGKTRILHASDLHDESEKDAEIRERSIAIGKDILRSRVVGTGGRHAVKHSLTYVNNLSVLYQREDGTIIDVMVDL